MKCRSILVRTRSGRELRLGVLGVALVLLVVHAIPAHALSRRRCRIACTEEIAACRLEALSARDRRQCKRTWVKSCRTTGLLVCQPTTTTTTNVTTTTATSSTTSTTLNAGLPYDLTGTWRFWSQGDTCDGVQIVQSACVGAGGYSCELSITGCDQYNFPFAPLSLAGTVGISLNPPYGPTGFTASFNLDGPNGAPGAWGDCHVFMDGAGEMGATYIDGHISCQTIGQPFPTIYFTGTRTGP